MKPFLRRAADVAEKALKIRLLRESSAPSWPEAEFARTLFRHLKPDCIFDVGANIGQYASELRTVEGFEGTIISFEPNPKAFERLRDASAHDPEWHCLPFALGRDLSRKTLNVTKSDGFASLRNVAASGREHFPWQVEIASTPEIEVRTLASEYPQLQRTYGFMRPFLKMDTQGYDLEVVRGAGDCLLEFCGLVSEVAITPLYEGAPSIQQSMDEFRAAGFSPVGLFNVQASDTIWELLECNCYCVRHDLIVPYSA